MIELKSCSAETHQGPYLNINEDAFEYDYNKGLYMILDGFGGSNIGDKCVDNIKDMMKSFYGRVSEDPDSTLPFYYSTRYLAEGNALINAVMYTHKNVFKENITKEVSQRAGASGIFAALGDSLVTLSSIGSCSAYLFRNGHLSSIFIPDNYELLSSEDHENHLKTLPLSSIGLYKDLQFQMKEVKVIEGDQIVLLTDGVYSRIDESELSHTLSSVHNPKEKINTLFKLSNSRGNMDNQTMMILEF
jgi:serine/threonine protein phosphatase PrpC